MSTTAQPISDQQKPTDQEIAQRLASFDVTVPNNALIVLVNAAKLAQSKGIFSLEEAELISKAIKTFTVVPPQAPQSTTEA